MSRAEPIMSRAERSPVTDERIGAAGRAQVLVLLSDALDAGLLPIEEYDARVAGVGAATFISDLRQQVADLPPAYAWGPPEVPPALEPPFPPPPPPPSAAGRVALILGLASVPLSLCVIGGVLGILAVFASRRRGPAPPGSRRITAALAGRVFGILGIVLSIGALTAIIYARNASLGP